MHRRFIVLTAVAAAIVAASALDNKPLHAIGSGLSAWNAATRWLTTVAPKAPRASALPKSLLAPQRPQQQQGARGQTGPTVTTDKSDYVPGSTAIITGSGFPATDESVTLQVRHTDGTAEGGEGHDPWTVAMDG